MRRLLLLTFLLLITGCDPSRPSSRGIELEIGDGPSSTGEYHRVPLRLSRSRSVFAPSGIYLEADLFRPSGVRGRLVLDLPDPAGAASGTPIVTYAEHDAGGRVYFASSRAAGRVELSADPTCPCQTGRLELLFTDAGLDGVLGTSDDRTRRIGSARLRLDGRAFCHGRAPIAIREELLVVGARACPVAGRRGGAGMASAWSIGGGLAAAWNDDGWYDEGWCGSYEEGSDGSWEEGWTDGYYDDGSEVDSGGEGGDPAQGDGGWWDDTWGSSWDDGWDGSDSGGGWGDSGSGGGWDDSGSGDGWDDSGSGDGWDDGSSWDDDSWGTDDEWDDGWDSGDDGSDDWSD